MKQSRSRMKGGLITALDVGSSKVCCAIAQVHGEGDFEVLGVSQQLSSGMKAGVITDMEDVLTSIVNTVHAAEKMAGLTIRDVIVSVNGSHLKSRKIALEMNVSGHPIDEADTRRILMQAKGAQSDLSLQILHMVPTAYSLDGIKGIKDPRGMHGNSLVVSLYSLLSQVSPLHNLTTCVARGHLQVSSLVAAPYASGLACLVEDEMELGALLIDMGGHTTSFAVFYDGQLRHAESIPIGGVHITMDIARGFSTTLSHAERLKTLYGSAISSAADDREMISVPLVGENRGESINQMPRAALVTIIKPRVEETFEYVRDRLIKSGIDPYTGGRVILTGGASQLSGVREVGSMILNKNVRLGKPFHLRVSEVSQDPSFSACAGLLSYGYAQHRATLRSFPEAKTKTFLNQVSAFVKQIW